MQTVFLVGMMGAGKTRTGRRLAAAMGIPFLDMDHELEAETNMSVTQIFAKWGEDRFRQMEQAWLQAFVARNVSAVVSTGGGTPCFFDNMQVMNEHGATIWLCPQQDELIERLWRNRVDRPKIADMPTKDALKAYLQQLFTQREPFYQQAKITVGAAIPDVQWLVKQLEDLKY